MEMKLQIEEAALLREILTEHLLELRMEVAGTENYDFRQELKQDEVVIKRMLAQLQGTKVSA